MVLLDKHINTVYLYKSVETPSAAYPELFRETVGREDWYPTSPLAELWIYEMSMYDLFVRITPCLTLRLKKRRIRV
jgi:hypothetical protein